jgi:hypothetical protein
MQTITLIFIITLLTGCTEFQTKMEEMNQLTCKPPHKDAKDIISRG